MSKRYIDTKIFDKPWFGDITMRQKLIWFYLFCQCDPVGIWEINMKKLNFDLGPKETEALVSFSEIEGLGIGSRILSISEKRIWLSGFIKFQYKTLNIKNHAQRGMIKNIVSSVGSLPLSGESKELIESFKAVLNDPQMTLNQGSTDPTGYGYGKGSIKREGKFKNLIKHQFLNEMDEIEANISPNGKDDILKDPKIKQLRERLVK